MEMKQLARWGWHKEWGSGETVKQILQGEEWKL